MIDDARLVRGWAYSNWHDSPQTSSKHCSKNRSTCSRCHPIHLGPLNDTFDKHRTHSEIAGSDLYYSIHWQKCSSVLQHRWRS